MSTATDNLATIEATLARLYAKDVRAMSQKDRAATFQDIQTVEASRDYWSREIATSSGARPRCASIDLGGSL